MKHFINDRDTIVTDAIDAAVMLGGKALARLDGYPAIKVIVRTDWDRSKVAVISGGGSGHEPSHAGFVGDGMLTAAICGDIFASPSVDAVLAGILAVTGDPGCLLIVKNYTGDRLSFGLAAERARALGRKVEMVIVSDDVAIEDAPSPRGLAGTLFVHKVAGHVARTDASLAAVKEAAERVAQSIVSFGVSLSSCTIPGRLREERMKADEVELGLGIHGEPGASVMALGPVRDLVRTMTTRLTTTVKKGAHDDPPLAILINDLGGVPPIEMAVATREILTSLGHRAALVVGPDRLMTSLDMKGLSISALPLDHEIEAALRSSVAPRAWPSPHTPTRLLTVPLPAELRSSPPPASAHPERRAILTNICQALLAARDELDALDSKVGDGDTGTTFATAANSILADVDHLPFGDASALCGALADRLSKVMGGSSGILLAIFVAGVGAKLAEAPSSWIDGLRYGLDRMQQYGGAREGDRTMLDALIPAVAALGEGGFDAAAIAARQGADRTAAMTKARAGRSSYVRVDALRGNPDPGAIAVARVFQALK